VNERVVLFLPADGPARFSPLLDIQKRLPVGTQGSPGKISGLKLIDDENLEVVQQLGGFRIPLVDGNLASPISCDAAEKILDGSFEAQLSTNLSKL
jgi:hypothetical protein